MAASDPSPGRSAASSGGSGSQAPADRARGSTVGAEVAARVEEIVRTAEREAEIIQRDLAAHRKAAEEQAQRYLDEAKREAEDLLQSRVDLVRELTDELLEHAEATRRQLDALLAWLDRANQRLQQEEVTASPAPKPPWGQRSRSDPARQAPLRRVADKPAPAPRAPKDRTAAAREATLNLDAARLLAIEMAVSGHTRQEVDAHLREAFRVTETAQLLDDVFGSGGGESRGGLPGR